MAAVSACLAAHPEWRRRLFIIVKVGIEFDEKQPYHLSGEEIRGMISDSLERLQLAKVDCIMLHRLPRDHPHYRAALLTLRNAKRAGICDSTGLSEVSVETILDADVNWIEIAYSPFVRVADLNGVIAAAKIKKCGVFTYTSVLRGLLTDDILRYVDADGRLKKEHANITAAELGVNPFEQTVGYYAPDVLPGNIEVVAAFLRFCHARSWDPAQVCLAYSIAKFFIPIPGTTKTKNLAANMGAAQIKLDDTDIARIDAITHRFSGDPNPSALSYLTAV